MSQYLHLLYIVYIFVIEINVGNIQPIRNLKPPLCAPKNSREGGMPKICLCGWNPNTSVNKKPMQNIRT